MERSFNDPALTAWFDRVTENYKRITDTIAHAAQQAGRDPSEITLLAATKTVPVPVIQHAIKMGVRLIGENRAQELLKKYNDLSLLGAGVHFIGRLQTNKVRTLIDKVDVIESVDSIRLAEEIGRRSVAAELTTDVLVEINIGDDANKAGIAPERTEEFLGRLSEIAGIRVRGLMTIPPISDNRAVTREYFSNIHKLFVDIRGKKLHNVVMDILSMGMSDDYSDAVAEGSTLVRVGSALFGTRGAIRQDK